MVDNDDQLVKMREYRLKADKDMCEIFQDSLYSSGDKRLIIMIDIIVRSGCKHLVICGDTIREIITMKFTESYSICLNLFSNIDDFNWLMYLASKEKIETYLNLSGSMEKVEYNSPNLTMNNFKGYFWFGKKGALYFNICITELHTFKVSTFKFKFMEDWMIIIENKFTSVEGYSPQRLVNLSISPPILTIIDDAYIRENLTIDEAGLLIKRGYKIRTSGGFEITL